MSIIEKLKSGERARLVPVGPESKKEERATSVLLAAFRIIPNFAKEVLEDAGASIGKRAKIECFTEVVFNGEDSKSSRPDGLIVVNTGKTEWSALVESKIGSAALSQAQIEQYLGVARSVGADALITISNDFAILPTHHPVAVNKALLKKANLFHFSWLSLISKAVLLSDNKIVTDIEQAFILAELIRYLESPNSGVSALTKMDAGWRNVCDAVQQGAPLTNIKSDVESAVSSWHQLLRYLSLRLSMATGSAVAIELSRKLQAEPEAQLKYNIDRLTSDSCLSAALNIPNAAAPIDFVADFVRRTVSFSMRLQAPQDIKRPTAGINWLTRQLKDVKNKEAIALRAHWPKRTPMTMGSLAAAIEQAEVMVPPGVLDIPKHLEVVVVVDLAGKFRGARTFIEETEREIKAFYKLVGQSLSKWQPKAPQIKSPRKRDDEGDSDQDIGLFSDEPTADASSEEPASQVAWRTFPAFMLPDVD